MNGTVTSGGSLTGRISYLKVLTVSAYGVAVANGFKGTEAEWLASLVGPQGPAGPAGDAGATGPAGKSAYEYARDGGFQGTEADFAALLNAGGATPNWSAAEGEAGHVLNRTHYVDAGGVAHPLQKVFLPSDTVYTKAMNTAIENAVGAAMEASY